MSIIPPGDSIGEPTPRLIEPVLCLLLTGTISMLSASAPMGRPLTGTKAPEDMASLAVALPPWDED
jgi:hypothetical protein